MEISHNILNTSPCCVYKDGVLIRLSRPPTKEEYEELNPRPHFKRQNKERSKSHENPCDEILLSTPENKATDL